MKLWKWSGSILVTSFMFITLMTTLGACSRSSHATKLEMPANMVMTNVMPSKKPDSTLAYTHELSVKIERDRLQGQVDAVRDECLADKQSSCTILTLSSEHSEYSPSARISMRLTPSSVGRLQKIAAEYGTIISSSISAEDLAPELSDTKQKLATLTSYHDRLNSILSKRELTPDQLISIARELSQAQSQIEELKGTHAKLQQRIDTDILNIHFSTPTIDYEQELTPIKDSINSFGQHFRSAVAAVIDFVSYLLPWIPVILFGFFGIRKLWRVLRRKPVSESQT